MFCNLRFGNEFSRTSFIVCTWLHIPFPFCFQGAVPWTNYHPTWQPRIPSDHTSLRILRRMPAKVRQCQCLEVFHRSVRLSSPYGPSRWPNFLPPWRSLPLNWHVRSYSVTRPSPGSPSRGTIVFYNGLIILIAILTLMIVFLGPYVRFIVVGSRWSRWLGHFTPRSWLHIRPRYFRNFQPLQQPDSGL